MLFIDAARDGDVDVVRAALAAGASVNRVKRWGRTALSWASSRDRTAVVDVLLAAGADANQADKKGDTVLIMASYKGRAAVVRALLAAGADVNKANDNGTTALLLASYSGHTAVVEMLLAAGADVDKVNKYDWTALSMASGNGRADVFALLKDAKRRARARHLLGKWRAATRTWCLTNWWWRVAGEGQCAPGMPGRKRARAEFMADCSVAI